MATLKNNRTIAQKKMILRLLEKGRKLTQLDVETHPEIKCRRLASRIWDLKQDGHPIVKEMITTTGGARVAQYSLKKTA